MDGRRPGLKPAEAASAARPAAVGDSVAPSWPLPPLSVRQGVVNCGGGGPAGWRPLGGPPTLAQVLPPCVGGGGGPVLPSAAPTAPSGGHEIWTSMLVSSCGDAGVVMVGWQCAAFCALCPDAQASMPALAAPPTAPTPAHLCRVLEQRRAGAGTPLLAGPHVAAAGSSRAGEGRATAAMMGGAVAGIARPIDFAAPRRSPAVPLHLHEDAHAQARASGDVPASKGAEVARPWAHRQHISRQRGRRRWQVPSHLAVSNITDAQARRGAPLQQEVLQLEVAVSHAL